jgi:hypothetical protein
MILLGGLKEAASKVVQTTQQFAQNVVAGGTTLVSGALYPFGWKRDGGEIEFDM